MDKKNIYMIGNSHIDPVWFWSWDEGMQEVKATFASALDRLNEFDNVKFTATSSCFFEWIEKIDKEMFEEIQRRVVEGRFEITGGWYIEPDCHLPSGESFVRQGLYAQRYFQKKFNKKAKIASNVDGFGHSQILPQIFKKSGMDYYICMRTGLNAEETPLFNWSAPDGSTIKTVSLPSEYTTWFYESTKKGIENTLKAAKKYSGLPCCYGVGNHGGGPTIENIKSIISLKDEFENTTIDFSTYEEFFNSLTNDDMAKMESISGGFENINVGCYSVDSKFKKLHRDTEKRLNILESILSLETLYTGNKSVKKEEIEKLWKKLLFNQFHDTLGGTYVKSGRDEAVYQLAGVCSTCKELWTIAVQNIINTIDTKGEGFPLILFNPTSIEFNGTMNVELNWFCKDDLLLRDFDGKEIPYQRVHTEAKVRNYNLGGRRGIAFNANIPPLGFSIYRIEINKSSIEFDARNGSATSPYIMENNNIKIMFNKNTGNINSIFDKKMNYESLNGDITFDVWIDERDTWGGMQGRPFYDTNQKFELVKLETIEEGIIRKVVRGIYKYEDSQITQIFILNKDSSELIVENYIRWNKPWHMLKHRIPINTDENHTESQGSYTQIKRLINDDKEYYMHNFVDVSDKNAQGLLFANNSKYGFSMDNNDLLVTVLRSSIYAQGNGKNWYEPLENYEYTDIGEDKFTYALKPHGKKVSVKERYKLANIVNDMTIYISDNIHKGSKKDNYYKGFEMKADNVILTAIKESEEDNGYILRFLELEGISADFIFKLNDVVFNSKIKPYEIKTVKIDKNLKNIVETNLLEENI